MKKVIGLGAGGHAKVVIDILSKSKEWEIIGLLDNNAMYWKSYVLDCLVLGGDELLLELFEDGLRFAFNGLGSTGDSTPRRKLFEKVKSEGYTFIQAVHPSVSVSDSAIIGEGSVVMAAVVINPCTHVGDNVIINSGAIIEHDCVIRNHVHISSGARLAGGVIVNQGVHVGLGANILQGITIGQNAIIGAGSNVLNDIEPNTVVVGNPAKVLRYREP